MSMKHKGDKRFNFLYNIDKDKSVKKFEDYAKSLEGLLNTDMVIGSDITGFETGISNEEYDSLKEKLEVILPVLHLHPQSILRICASGFKDSTETIHKVMGAIYEVCAKLNESCVDMFGSEWGILPPPRLRLAHGLKLEENKDLIKLIHGFDAVVEYTLSTNRTLRKVSDFSKLSLGYYDKNKIKYVFSNDLGGLYYFDNKEIENIVVDTKQDILAALQEKPFVVPMVEEKEEQKTEIKEEPKVEPVKEEIKEEEIEPIKEEEKEEPKVIQQINEIEDEITEEENSLEQTLYDLFAELKNNSTDDVVPEEEKLVVPMVEEETQEEKQEVEEEKEEPKEEVHIEESNIDNKDYNSYAEALEDENKIFTYDGNVLSESEKVNDEIFRIRKYVSENTNDLDNDYIEKKISVVNSYNDNSNNSDYAKMYLFLLEREILPDFNTAFKSVEYLYKNKDKEKNNIEKELDRIFNMVTDQYDHE